MELDKLAKMAGRLRCSSRQLNIPVASERFALETLNGNPRACPAAQSGSGISWTQCWTTFVVLSSCALEPFIGTLAGKVQRVRFCARRCGPVHFS
jgi:hypothetical protein